MTLPKRSVLIRRFQAVLLGFVLAAGGLGASYYWQMSLVHGLEVCSRCGVERDVDRSGPFWTYSDPRPSRSPAWVEAIVAPCSEHTWKRTGCWREGGGYHYLAPVRP